MAITSGFHNSINGDRKYGADFFALFFGTLIANGVFPNPSTGLQVTANSNMTTSVKAGKGWINGYFIVNEGDYVLKHDNADGVLKRLDRVVMKLNHVKREIEVLIKKGTFSSSPVAPTLQRDADAHELALADVLINNGATQITQANITDQRLNTALCGIVHGTVNQVDTTTIFNQYQAWFNDIKGSVSGELDAWQDAQEQEFLTWFESIKDILDGDVAANLAARVANLEQGLANHLTDVSHIKWIETVGGTANALTATVSGITSYKNGLAVSFPATSNSTAAMTLNINGLGVIPIKKANGAAFSNAKVNGVYTVRYRAGAFILQGESEVEVGRQIITPSTVNQTISQGVHDGTGYVVGSPNLFPANIANGVNIFGVVGTLTSYPSFSYGTTVIGGMYGVSQTSIGEWRVVKTFYPKFTGKVTMVFDLSRYGGSGEVMYAQVTVNGVRVGESQYTTNSAAPSLFSVDMDVTNSSVVRLNLMSGGAYVYATNTVVLLCVSGTPPLATFEKNM